MNKKRLILSVLSLFSLQLLFGKEIRGSSPDGTVLHKDIIEQRAEPGDTVLVFKGNKLDTPIILGAGDINYSKQQYEIMQRELKASVRNQLNKIFELYDIPVINKKETAPDWPIVTSKLSGKTVQFISDLSDRKQKTLIVCASKNFNYWKQEYKGKPYAADKNKLPANMVMYALIKPINESRDDIYSYNEDMAGVKAVLDLILKTPKDEQPKAITGIDPDPPFMSFGFYFGYGSIVGINVDYGFFNGSLDFQALSANLALPLRYNNLYFRPYTGFALTLSTAGLNLGSTLTYRVKEYKDYGLGLFAKVNVILSAKPQLAVSAWFVFMQR